MQFSDLHIHSRYSDGMLWPEQVASIASKKGLSHISITDHDTVDSQFHIKELSEKYNINIITGLELSTEYKEREIHILAYFIDVYNDNLTKILNKTKESRIDRAKEIICKLNSININITYEDIDQKDVSIGRAHIAKAMVDKGYCNNVKEAFQRYLIKDRLAYVARYKINYKDAFKIIKDSGGIPVLAHPGEVYKGISTVELIKEFKVYGLRGIEVFHPSHSIKQTNDYYNLAKKYSILITGGSDCHSAADESEMLIGKYGIDKTLIHKLLKAKYSK